jgi:thiol:disulfide interchange protein DsbC
MMKFTEVNMRKIFFSIAALLLLLPASHSYAFSEKGQDCAKCHTLSKDEAATLLKDIIPNPKILDISMSPVKAMWEVDVDSQGRKGVVYVGFSKRYVMSGALIDLREKRNLTQEKSEELNKIVLSKDDVSKIPVEDALVMGDKDAKHKVIVFDDPE